MNVQTLRLDVSKDVIVQQPVIIGQGDKSGTTITATIYDNGILLTQSGLSARFKMRLPDGGHFYSKAASWTASTGTASVTIDETQAASAPGTTHDAYFELYSGGSSNPTTIYSTSRFTVRVLRSATEAATTAKSYDDRIDEIIAELDDADEAIQAAQSAASAANTAAQSANSAATSANSAASAATTARNNANSAASSATSAAQSATSAASSANTAAGSANSAAQSASSAATAANSAATSATSAVDAATSAATDASTAASAASSAASSASTAATAASNAANAANSAASAANSAASDASTAATAANNAASAANDAAGRAEDAVDAIGDISELAVPLMSETTRGGATVGAGLAVINGALTADPTRTSDGSTAGPILSLSAEGWAEQDTTVDPPSPSPEYPQEIRVARGRNLLDKSEAESTSGHCYANGNYANNASWCVLYAPCVAGETYTISGLKAVSGMQIVSVTQKGAAAASQVLADRVAKTTYTVTPTASGFIAVSCVIASANYELDTVQLELGSTLNPYVPYGHVGLEVQGKNLLENLSTTMTTNGVTFTVNDDGTITANGTATANATCYLFDNRNTVFLPDATYTVSLGVETNDVHWAIQTSGNSWINRPTTRSLSGTVISFWVQVKSGRTVNNLILKPQLERGSVATDYEPYYHSTTPIPLPSKGFAAALPDGTHDTLMIDGAGKVTWESACEETTQAVTDGVTGTVGVNVMSSTGQIADGATVLYKLATPTTEDAGYVDADVPVGASISIPELEGLGVEYFTDEAAMTLARQWYERASAVESRVAALEEAVAEIVAGA